MFILILGGTLIAFGPILVTAAFYKVELGAITANSNGGNVTSSIQSLYQSGVDAVSQAEIIILVGVILAPVGGAMVAHGLLPRSRAESSPVQPSKAEGM